MTGKKLGPAPPAGPGPDPRCEPPLRRAGTSARPIPRTGTRRSLRMPSSGIVGLNWAQQAWLLGPHDDLRDLTWRHRCELSVPLRVRIDAGRTRTAFERLVVRFPMLRAVAVSGADGEIAQTLLPTASAKDLLVFEVEDRNLNDASSAQIDKVAREENRLNIAVVLVQEPSRSTLILKAAHFFLDAYSLTAIASEAVRIIESGCASEEAEEDRSHWSILEYEKSPEALRRSARNIRHLCDIADEAARLGLAKPYSLQRESSIGGSCSRRLEVACRTLAASTRASLPAVLLSLFLIVYNRMFGPEHAWLAVCSANRITPDELRYVGLQTRHGALLADVGLAAETFAEFAGRTGQSLVHAVQNARHDPRGLVAEYSARGLPGDPPFFFNYVHGAQPHSPIVADPVAGIDALDFPWVSAPSGRFALELNCFSLSGLAGVNVEHDPGIFPRESMTELMNSILRLAERIADRGTSIRVGELRRGGDA
ncbi:condensation domain-containing protein [Streptomyces sp. NPDC050287]|uniref:condensation domain-containing protein n=1 Tax=Streptomyces sp. NPDC050287 TaxID=3365608 RepID=UPI0037A1292B